MNEQLKELIAMGASAALNCHPCLRHHLAACDRLAIPRDEVRAAIEVGQMVNRGAAGKTRNFVADLLSEQDDPPVAAAAAGCGCS